MILKIKRKIKYIFNKFKFPLMIALILLILNLICLFLTQMYWQYGLFLLGIYIVILGFKSFPSAHRQYYKFDKEVRMVRQWTPLTQERYQLHKGMAEGLAFLPIIGAVVAILPCYFLLQTIWGCLSICSTVVGIILIIIWFFWRTK